MIIRISRLFVILACLVMALPLTLALVPSGQEDASQAEGRRLAPWPPLPRTAREWRVMPRALDAFLADHFGLRDVMTRWQSRVAYLWLREANADVLVGGQGRLFYYGDDAVAQSAGAVLHAAAIRRTVEVVSGMQAVLADRGIKLVVASPPNAASIYEDALPAWARRNGRETEPDLVLRDLRARGLNVVDLRRVLTAARDQGELYHRTDTHWTPLGTIIGFNAIAAGAGHADWAIDPASVTGGDSSVSGDLARMLGVGADLSETYRDWSTAAPEIETRGPPDAALQLSKGRRDGPAVLVLGDSFSEISFTAMLAGHAGRIGWLANQNCTFDWSWIDDFKPAEVWWVPTERLMLCSTDAWPKGMPHPGRVDVRSQKP